MKLINLTHREFMQGAAALGLVAAATLKVSLGAGHKVLQRPHSPQ